MVAIASMYGWTDKHWERERSNDESKIINELDEAVYSYYEDVGNCLDHNTSVLPMKIEPSKSRPQ